MKEVKVRKKHFWSQYVAEFIGTFFLIFFGCGAVILSQITPNSMHPFIIPIIFGGTVSIMIYATGHLSGAHFNPAVSIAFWLVKRFPFHKLFPYFLSQISGGLLASFLHSFVWGQNHNFGITTLSVQPEVGIVMEFILSFVLMFVIIAVATDSRAVGELAGIAIGTTITLSAYIGGPLTGASMNPARSLAPALIKGEFQHLWVYLFIPILGTTLAAFIYEKIRCHKEKEEEFYDKHGCC